MAWRGNGGEGEGIFGERERVGGGETTKLLNNFIFHNMSEIFIRFT